MTHYPDTTWHCRLSYLPQVLCSYHFDFQIESSMGTKDKKSAKKRRPQNLESWFPKPVLNWWHQTTVYFSELCWVGAFLLCMWCLHIWYFRWLCTDCHWPRPPLTQRACPRVWYWWHSQSCKTESHLVQLLSIASASRCFLCSPANIQFFRWELQTWILMLNTSIRTGVSCNCCTVKQLQTKARIRVLRYCACIAVIHAVRTYKSISFLHAPFMISDVQEYMRCSLLSVTVTIGKAGLLICSLYAMITFFLSAARSRSPAALTSPSCSRRCIFIALTVTPRSVDFAFVALKRASAPALLTCSHSFGLWRRYFCFAFSKIARSSSPLAA